MLSVDELTGAISLTRGDTARFSVYIYNGMEDEDYSMKEGDELAFSVKKSVNDAEYSFQKIVRGTTQIHISPEDTKNLAFGKYKYDVQLTTVDGDVYTIIGPTTFEVTQEVT